LPHAKVAAAARLASARSQFSAASRAAAARRREHQEKLLAREKRTRQLANAVAPLPDHTSAAPPLLPPLPPTPEDFEGPGSESLEDLALPLDIPLELLTHAPSRDESADASGSDSDRLSEARALSALLLEASNERRSSGGMASDDSPDARSTPASWLPPWSGTPAARGWQRPEEHQHERSQPRRVVR
jgi:hypothetical protein